MSTTVETTSGIQIETAQIGEWVGLHYGRNFDEESAEKKQEWVDRYAQAHELSKPFLNVAQRSCLGSYANGEFEHLGNIRSEDEFKSELDNCGDGLFRFLMTELASSEDCDSLATALQRLGTAIDQIETVKYWVDDLPAETPWETGHAGKSEDAQRPRG